MKIVRRGRFRPLWPEDPRAIQAKAAEIGAKAAFDGMTLERECRFPAPLRA